VLENVNVDYISGFELSVLAEPGRVTEHVRSAWQPAPGVDGRVAAVSAVVTRLADWIQTGRRSEPNLRDGARIEALLEHARSDRR
jgi:hypothetical protein